MVVVIVVVVGSNCCIIGSGSSSCNFLLENLYSATYEETRQRRSSSRPSCIGASEMFSREAESLST